jgi:hypothetical protein
MRAMEGTRVLFMPHSEGIYIAMVLKNAEEIDLDYTTGEKEFDLNESISSIKQNESAAP